jgi:hypothetical protein
MLQYIKYSLTGMLTHWCPHTFVSRKLNQADESKLCPYSSNPLEGTVATCELDGAIIYKRLRTEFTERDARDLRMLAMIVKSPIISGWAMDSARYEYDLLHEADMQEAFWEAWQNDSRMSIPKVHRSLSSATVLAMDFVPWERLENTLTKEHVAAAVLTVARFFFYSIAKHHLLHGDISTTNVLVNPNSLGHVSILDFGLSRCLAEGEAEALLRIRQISHTSRLILGSWNKDGHLFNDNEWTMTLLPAILGGHCDADATIDGTFVRSLVSLTRMACHVGLQVPSDIVTLFQ